MCDGVIYRKLSIVAEVSHTPPLMYKVDTRSSLKHLEANYGSHHAILAEVNSQISPKMTNLGYYHIITGNEVMCCEKRHLLLLKHFITFLICMRKMNRASDSIFKPLVVYTVLFPLRSTLKVYTKY